jgi:predicted ester cyclase
MTRDDLDAFFTRRLAAWQRLDATALANDYTESATVDSPLAGGSATGREAIERLYLTYFAAFPDFKLEQEIVLVDGDHVAQLVRVTGTDNGGFMGMAPTGRKITFRCALFHTMQGALIARERRVYDFTGLLIQVGLLKAKPV